MCIKKIWYTFFNKSCSKVINISLNDWNNKMYQNIKKLAKKEKKKWWENPKKKKIYFLKKKKIGKFLVLWYKYKKINRK